MAIRSANVTVAVTVVAICISFLNGTNAWSATPSQAPTQEVPPAMSDGWRFDQTDGAALYRATCQGCHMPQGQGAKGAGMYPALANNARLASSAYVAYTVLKGRKGMPGFAGGMSDAQVAAVVGFVRTNFGNPYAQPITAAEVGALR